MAYLINIKLVRNEVWHHLNLFCWSHQDKKLTEQVRSKIGFEWLFFKLLMISISYNLTVTKDYAYMAYVISRLGPISFYLDKTVEHNKDVRMYVVTAE